MSVRAGRVAVAIVLLAAGLAVAALSVVHRILSRDLLRRWVNSDPEELFLDYDEASLRFPGTIRVRGLTLRGSDPTVQWSFRMEKAVVSISLLDLLHREFHATRVRAEGLTFRLREKKKRTALSPAHEALVPSIPGFTGPPLKTREAPPPPLSAAERRRFWTIHIENLVADPASDIWIEIYRFRGQARVTGGFLLRPHAHAQVGPAAVDFLSGTFALGQGPTILSHASGRADCVIDRFDPDLVRGQEVWPRISGNVRLEGRLEDIRFANHFLRHTPEPRLAGGGGQARLSVRFDHGIGRGSGEFEIPRVTFAYSRGTLAGRASGRLAVARWDVEHYDMGISGSRIDLADVITSGTKHGEQGWWGRFDFPSGHLRGGLSAEMAVSCRDARPLYTLFRANLPGWAEGILKLNGITGRAHVRLAHQLTDVEGLEASGGKFRIAGRYRDKGDDRQGAFLIESGPLAAGVEIAGPAARVKLLGAKKWFAEANSSGAAASKTSAP
jgi:hypothetical protein